jgi:uncharacterized protein (DUF952 family)
MALIYHIVRESIWRSASQAGSYRGDTLDREGFIHCSTRDQVARTANYLFSGQADLVLLEIDEDRLVPDLRYERSTGEERFPHIYGPLNLDAVVRVVAFPPQPDGSFAFPDDLNPERG